MKKFNIENLKAQFNDSEINKAVVLTSVKNDSLDVVFSYDNKELFTITWVNQEAVNECFDGERQNTFELWLHSLDKLLYDDNDKFVHSIIEYANLIGVNGGFYADYKSELKEILNQNLKDFDQAESDIAEIRDIIYQMRIVHENDVE